MSSAAFPKSIVSIVDLLNPMELRSTSAYDAFGKRSPGQQWREGKDE